MAAIEGLTQPQNDSLAGLEVGDLLIVHNPHYVAPPDDSGWAHPTRGYTGHINAGEIPAPRDDDDWAMPNNAGEAIGDPGPDGYVSDDSNYVRRRPRSPWVEDVPQGEEQTQIAFVQRELARLSARVPTQAETIVHRAEVEMRQAQLRMLQTQDMLREAQTEVHELESRAQMTEFDFNAARHHFNWQVQGDDDIQSDDEDNDRAPANSLAGLVVPSSAAQHTRAAQRTIPGSLGLQGGRSAGVFQELDFEIGPAAEGHDAPEQDYDGTFGSLRHPISGGQYAIPGSFVIEDDRSVGIVQQWAGDRDVSEHNPSSGPNRPPHGVSAEGNENDSPDPAENHLSPTNDTANPNEEDPSGLTNNATGYVDPFEDASLTDDVIDPDFEPTTESDQSSEEDDYTPQMISPKPSHMFVVHSVDKDESGVVVDMQIRLLHHDSHPNGEGSRFQHSYQIYGTECVYHPAAPNPFIGQESHAAVVSMKNVVDHPTLTIFARPGDAQTKDVFGYESRCPLHCHGGWLHDIVDLENTIPDYQSPAARDHRPLCPCCMGIPLVQEQQTLQSQLEHHGAVDIGTLVEFYGRVNQRLEALRYQFRQFDEREWGYHFDDDMQDDDRGDDGDATAENQFETWVEAQDPNRDIITNPASEITIAALPRKAYAEVKPVDKDDEGPCAVCREDMQDNTTVVILPCKHFFCAGGCIEMWLRQFNTCPACRAEVPDYTLPDNEDTYETYNALDYVSAVTEMLAGLRPVGVITPLHQQMLKLYTEETRAALQVLFHNIVAGQLESPRRPIDHLFSAAANAQEGLRILFPNGGGQAWFMPNDASSGGRTLRDSGNRSRRLARSQIHDLATIATSGLLTSFRERWNIELGGGSFDVDPRAASGRTEAMWSEEDDDDDEEEFHVPGGTGEAYWTGRWGTGRAIGE